MRSVDMYSVDVIARRKGCQLVARVRVSVLSVERRYVYIDMCSVDMCRYV